MCGGGSVKFRQLKAAINNVSVLCYSPRFAREVAAAAVKDHEGKPTSLIASLVTAMQPSGRQLSMSACSSLTCQAPVLLA